MSMAEELARFAVSASYDNLSREAREQLKIRVLDSLACAIGALEAEPIQMIRAHVEDVGGAPHAVLIGGGHAPADRAAFYNGALIRYLDYNDSYLARGETCHPSDNLAPVLAATEYVGGSGREFLGALAVAYHVQCRLSDVAPVRHKGFDHTVQGAYAAAAGIASALHLDPARAAHAIAISGTAQNALRVTRTGRLSHWKGLAYPNVAFGAIHAALLAMRGITGPLEVIEGRKGFMESIAGRFQIDWTREDLERVRQTIVKKYNAEIHSQSAIEGILELGSEGAFQPADIDRIVVDIFDVAFHIIGGGEEGAKIDVETKEEADHSLPYLLAVAVIDGDVGPPQYRLDRIRRDDVQHLLRRVEIRPAEALSRRFPREMGCAITVTLRNGHVLKKDKRDYEGFTTRPFSWQRAAEKLERLAPMMEASRRSDLLDVVWNLDQRPIADLARVLEAVTQPTTELHGAV